MKKPTIGITIGDYNGIGPEVVVKSLLNENIIKKCRPVVIGDCEVLECLKIKIPKEVEIFKIDYVGMF